MKEIKCPHCSNDDISMLERLYESTRHIYYLCAVCGKKFIIEKEK